jgi:uracil-DNA glycosylase
MSARRDAVLREMGLGPLWRLRSRDSRDAAIETAQPPVDAPVPRPAPVPQSHAPGPVMPKAGQQADAPAALLPDEGRSERIARLDWEAMESDISACRSCPLCEGRQRVVPGMGDHGARVMFVGEGPGAEEDRQGLPFVGAAGKLLDAMLGAIGLSRESGVYIANTVKCRPPRNRTPEPEEMAACRPYLKRQIELVRPSLLVALGRPAAQVLLNAPDVRINAARGRMFNHEGIPVLVTYHPAYLLRNPLDKARAWEDLCAIRRHLSENAEEG